MLQPLEINISLKVTEQETIKLFTTEAEVVNLTVKESGGGMLPVYTGETIVTPKTVGQNLETANKSVLNDINVLAIPVSRVSNPSGGLTVSIAYNG